MIYFIGVQGRSLRSGRLEFLSILNVERAGVAHGDGALDDHHSVGVHLQHGIDDGLDSRSIEEILLTVIVGGSGDDDELGITVAGFLVEGSLNAEGLVGKVILDIIVLYGRLLIIHQIDAFWNHVDTSHVVMPGQQGGDGKTDIAGTRNGNVHG